MNEIVAKLADSLSMFWQSLDDQERRLLVLGVAWVAASVVLGAVERQRKARELDELAERVAARLRERGSRG
jgi:hypothetical protein